MDELDLFRSFNRGAAPPSGDAQRRASVLLARAIAGETAGGDGVRWSRRRFGGRVVAMRFVLVAASVTVAAAAALFIKAPWSNSPSFLARAEAALAPPRGMILHSKSVETSISRHPKCTVTWSYEVWSDAVSQRYRAVVRDPFFPDPSNDVILHPRWCSRGRAYEIGTRAGEMIISFVPPNRLVYTGLPGTPPNLAFGFGEVPGDPVAALRRALRNGKARSEGRTTRDGRTVEHIGFTWGDAYVDPDTFDPIEIVFPGSPDVQGYYLPSDPTRVFRYSAYEYLPRTAANVALTDIRAQHPHASGP